VGAFLNMQLSDRLGLGKVGFSTLFFYITRLKLMAIHQMLVVGALFQIAAFLVQFLALPFPAFALSFTLGGIGIVFQVGIIYKEIQAIIFLFNSFY
jgi:hypothetical protein